MTGNLVSLRENKVKMVKVKSFEQEKSFVIYRQNGGIFCPTHLLVTAGLN